MAIAYGDKGRAASTEYKTLKEFKNHSLLEVRIHTGRTHQIRVHLAYLNCPVVADTVYGYKHPSLPLQRQFLHAYELTIRLPEQVEATKFTAELPTDLQDVLNELF